MEDLRGMELGEDSYNETEIGLVWYIEDGLDRSLDREARFGRA